MTSEVVVSVVGSRPLIWRRLELAGDLELADVFEAVRTAFGWSGHLLHLFRLTEAVPGAVGATFSPAYGRWPRAGHDEAGVRLDEVVRVPGDRLDIALVDEGGDEWALTLRLDRFGPPSARAAACVGGERARPPVDAVDIDTFNVAVAQWLAGTPAGERLVWWPSTYDPEAFDADVVDRLLGLVLPSRRVDLARASRDVQDLAARCMDDGVRMLEALVAEADLEPRPPTPPEVERCVEPWLAMLDAVGDGVEVDPADAGSSGSTVLAPPDADRRLLGFGVGLGLLRAQHGRLVPTAVARHGRLDPGVLWRHLAIRLPGGPSRCVRDAGLVTMLQLAATGRASGTVTARVLDSAGWTDRGDPVCPATADRWSEWVRVVVGATDPLNVTSETSGRGAAGAGGAPVGAAGRLLCRAALVSPRAKGAPRA